MKKKCTAILLAAGAGRRMESKVAKQYMLLADKPVIWYGLQAFKQSAVIDDVVLVVGKGEIPYVRKEIVEKYGFSKVSTITEGGAERYLSVQKALAVMEHHDGYVFIHDGARPLITEKIIEDTYRAAEAYGACCAAVPVKDTIKIADENGFAAKTPDRSRLFAVQTPQVFETALITEAYRLLNALNEGGAAPAEKSVCITDDAMVVETMLHHPVKLVEASYENIKITTPEDMEVAERFLERRQKQ